MLRNEPHLGQGDRCFIGMPPRYIAGPPIRPDQKSARTVIGTGQ